MKKISKLKLNALIEQNLEKREQATVVGGMQCCTCSCGGPSSAADNSRANYGIGSGGYSPNGYNSYAYCN